TCGRLEFGEADTDGLVPQRLDTTAGTAFTNLRQSLCVFLDVASQTLWKLLPFDVDCRFDRWLGKLSRGPPSMLPTFAFQALARSRRKASLAGLLHRLR